MSFSYEPLNGVAANAIIKFDMATGYNASNTNEFKTISGLISSLTNYDIIAYCIDDPKFPFKGVRGKAKVKIHEDVNHNIPIAKKFIMKSIGSLDNPIAKWILTEIESGNEVILEITPKYYSTWRSAVPVK